MMTCLRCRLAVGAAVSVLLCASANSQEASKTAAEFRVMPEVACQTMAGFGAGVCEGTLQEIEALKQKDRQRLYDLVYGDDGLGLNIVRIHISATAQPLAADAPLRKQGLRYDWQHDVRTQNVYKAVAPALKRGRMIVYAVPFSPPARWKSNKQLTPGGSVARENYREYAEYLADFADYYRKVHGVTIDVLSLQNEPDVTAPWDSCRWTGRDLAEFLKVLAPLFQERRLATTFMLPEGTSWRSTCMLAASVLDDAEARRLVTILASHSYQSDTAGDMGRELLRGASERYKLPVWMSEMCLMWTPDDPGMDAALKIAGMMHDDIVRGGAAAWIYCFVIFTPKFPGSMGVLSPVTPAGELVVPKRFWAMANYSRFVRPGWKRIGVEGSALPSSAFVSPDGDRLAIVAINPGGKERSASYDLGHWAVSSVETYTTSSTADLKSSAVQPGEQRSLAVTLPPRSITTIVGKLRRRDAAKRSPAGEDGDSDHRRAP
jgi:glucuronoarabinoxylan endo-1,4-beta-xylanase